MDAETIIPCPGDISQLKSGCGLIFGVSRGGQLFFGKVKTDEHHEKYVHPFSPQ
ncbi:hypothetical protein [Klebsiella sp. BIGb0407]|uniref:hypothetical protein n=1 Tax=Klebsiella sp. BIGb0407 TaxID=2940603 RepID=UPI002169C965|nr:hypothetical protein [Klebsiella sp. BIGb0407]MCS3431888.1 hypothetical protein [Klebsiella sp. BIGb0407]